MNLEDYKKGDKVQVLMNNPKNNNQNEWRNGKIINSITVYPQYGYIFKPYTVLIITCTRTYFTQEKGFYDKKNTEGFIYANQVKLKTNLKLKSNDTT